MNWNVFSNTDLIEHLGWTLVHSLWQFALVAVVLWVILNVLRSGPANVRYVLSVGALAFAVALPVATFLQVSEPARATLAALREAPKAEDVASDYIPGSSPVTGERFANRNGQQPAFGDDGFESLANLRAFVARQFPVLFPFAVAIWLLGVAVFSLRLAGGVFHLRRLKNTEIGPLDGEWNRRFAELCRTLKVDRTVKIVKSNLLETPIAVGVVKPMILVPAALFLQVDPRQLESIIAHELVHIRRLDPLVSIVQGIAETLFFYHPCLWWISRQVKREREFAADAAVVELFADDRVVYATALANLEEIRLTAKTNAPSIAAAANGGNLMQRINRILNGKTEIPRANSAWSAGLAVALISAVLLAVFSFSPGALVNAQRKPKDRKIAIGFVGIPPVDRSENPPKDADATARLIIAKLQQHQVPAIGFLTGGLVSDGEKLFPVRANIVRLWRDAGLEVGIGNFRHIWFYNTPYDDFVAGVEKNEAVAKKILGEKGLPLRYFSYPYLNTGKSIADRDRFESWLAGQGLRSAKYTIDNQEWMYSYAYDMARNDNDVNTMTEIRVAFVKYMDKMFDHYEAYSQEMFGRQIPQTMVLTPSRLVADSADDLFGMIRNRGYSFVSMDDALADDAYKTPENMFGQFGNSWFERWTYSQGKKLRDEPKVDESVEKIWQEKKPKS